MVSRSRPAPNFVERTTTDQSPIAGLRLEWAVGDLPRYWKLVGDVWQQIEAAEFQVRCMETGVTIPALSLYR